MFDGTLTAGTAEPGKKTAWDVGEGFLDLESLMGIEGALSGLMREAIEAGRCGDEVADANEADERGIGSKGGCKLLLGAELWRGARC